MVTLALGERVRQVTDLYRAEWRGAPGPMPLMGVSRHIVVADSDEQAKRSPAPPTPAGAARWHCCGSSAAPIPARRAPAARMGRGRAMGHGCAGSPDTVRAFVEREAEASGITYFVSALAFGDLPLDAVTRSAELFARHVMPAFAASLSPLLTLLRYASAWLKPPALCAGPRSLS